MEKQLFIRNNSSVYLHCLSVLYWVSHLGFSPAHTERDAIRDSLVFFVRTALILSAYGSLASSSSSVPFWTNRPGLKSAKSAIWCRVGSVVYDENSESEAKQSFDPLNQNHELKDAKTHSWGELQALIYFKWVFGTTSATFHTTYSDLISAAFMVILSLNMVGN